MHQYPIVWCNSVRESDLFTVLKLQQGKIKITEQREVCTGFLFINLVELAKAIATSTYNLNLVFSCCICPEGRP